MEQGSVNTRGGFMKLEAWRQADDLASEVFRLTEEEMDPRHRWLGLQFVRAAFSVTANISEGYGRSSLGDYLRFLEIAAASLNEVENAIHFIKRNRILAPDTLSLAEQLRRTTGNLLFGLIRALRLKLKNKETWQRGLREQPADYGTDALGRMFPVPGSMFPDTVPGSQFHDSEG